MAIAFDAATDGGNASATSLSFNHTSTGTNLVGFVGIVGDVITGGADDISGVTWGGAACSFVSKNTTEIGAGGLRFSYLYRIEGQATGSQSIVVSASSSHLLLAGSVSYSGASQTGQPDAIRAVNQTSDLTTATLTSALTSINDLCWFVLMEFGLGNGTNPPAAGTGSTRRTFDGAFGVWGLFDSNSAQTPAGSYSMTTTRGSPSTLGITHLMASFKPPGAGRTVLNTRSNPLGMEIGMEWRMPL